MLLGEMAYLSKAQNRSSVNAGSYYNNTFQDTNVSEQMDYYDILESGPIYIYPLGRIAFIIYLTLMVVLVSLENAVLVWIIMRFKQFHKPNYVLLAVQASYEVVSMYTWVVPALHIMVINQVPFAESEFKCVFARVFQFWPHLIQMHSLAFIALERSIFFQQPFLHSRIFSVRMVLLVEGLLNILTLTFVLGWSLSGQTFVSLPDLTCAVENKHYRILIKFIVYYVFSSIIILVCTLTLWAFVFKLRRQLNTIVIVGLTRHITSIPQNTENQDNHHTHHHVSQVTVAIKLLAGVSGTYLIGYFPSMIAIMIILHNATFIDIQLAQPPKYYILTRFFSFSIAIPWLSHPVIYMFLYPALRKKLKYVLCRAKKNENSHDQHLMLQT